MADTILFGPGERYDLILRADNPGIWMVHDHIDRHTVNGKSPMGGIMTTIEYDEIAGEGPGVLQLEKQEIRAGLLLRGIA